MAEPIGRPTDYEPAFCEVVHNLCVSGSTDFEVAESLGIHVSTLYRWQKIHPEFREALQAGKEICDERVERSLFHRAVGYSFNAVHFTSYEGGVTATPYVEHVPPDVGAATLWLTNRQPQKWRSKTEAALTHKSDGPLTFQMIASDIPTHPKAD
jgi:hypothetical protein